MDNEKHCRAGQDMLLGSFKAPFGKPLPRKDTLKNTDSEKGSRTELGLQTNHAAVHRCIPWPPSTVHMFLQTLIVAFFLRRHTLPHSLLVQIILITNINNLLNAYLKLSIAQNSSTCIVSFNLSPNVVITYDENRYCHYSPF